MRKALAIAAAIIGLLVFDGVLVLVEFASSRWILPWLGKANPVFITAVTILLFLLVLPRCRYFAAQGIIFCGVFFGLTFVAGSFVIESDLGGLFGPLVAFFSAGFLVPALAILTALFQREWSILGQMVGELLLTVASLLIGSWAASRAHRMPIATVDDSEESELDLT